MQTPDKATRLKYYREVLDSYVKDNGLVGWKGICDRLFMFYYRDLELPIYVDRVHKLYPELSTFKPINVRSLDYWFDTTEERIKCLKKCIEMCEESVDQGLD